MTTLSQIEREAVTTIYPEKLKVLFWVVFQIGIILILEILGCRPSRLIPGCSYFGGPSGGIYATLFYAICFILCVIYTWVGLGTTARLGMNSHKWWNRITILYATYAVICTLGLYIVIGEWFFDGFGAYAIDVCIAPILWLGELELMQLLRKRMIEGIPSLLCSIVFWVIVQSCCILLITELGLFPGRYIHRGLRLWYNGFSWSFMLFLAVLLELAYTSIACLAVFRTPINTQQWWARLLGIYLLYISVSSVPMLYKMGILMCHGYWVYIIDIWILPVLWWIEIEGILIIRNRRRIARYRDLKTKKSEAK